MEGRCHIKQIAVPTFSFRSYSKESLVSLVSSKVWFWSSVTVFWASGTSLVSWHDPVWFSGFQEAALN